MQYLQEHKLSIPVPKPLDLVELSGYHLLFMSFMPGTTLETAWANLEEHQKVSISDQLNKLFTELRSIPYIERTPLGGVGGEGCKDLRRALRRCSKFITTMRDFEAFLFSNPHYGSPIFIYFLQRFLSLEFKPPNVVFTH